MTLILDLYSAQLVQRLMTQICPKIILITLNFAERQEAERDLRNQLAIAETSRTVSVESALQSLKAEEQQKYTELLGQV